MGVPRLYVHLILSAREYNFASVWATVCFSWVWLNSYTSGRSLLNPEGDVDKEYVKLANMMMSRTVLFSLYMVIAVYGHGCLLLEHSTFQTYLIEDMHPYIDVSNAATMFAIYMIPHHML